MLRAWASLFASKQWLVLVRQQHHTDGRADDRGDEADDRNHDANRRHCTLRRGAASEDAEYQSQNGGDIAANREDRNGNADDAKDEPRYRETAAFFRRRHWRRGIAIRLGLLVRIGHGIVAALLRRL